jgi:hypothetical protein
MLSDLMIGLYGYRSILQFNRNKSRESKVNTFIVGIRTLEKKTDTSIM